MKKFLKRTVQLIVLIFVTTIVIGLLNKPSNEEAIAAGFEDIEQFEEYKRAGYDTLEQFELTGFTDLDQSNQYNSAGFQSIEEFKSSDFDTIEEAQSFRDLGFTSKVEFSKTGFKSLIEAAPFIDAGFSTKQAFDDSGFADLKQAQALKKYGMNLTAAIAAGNSVPLDKFIECDKAGRSMYDNECFGNRVIWYAKVDRYADDGVYLDAVDSCSDTGAPKAVWSKELSYDFWKENDKACILIEAEIREENFMTPTIVVDKVLWIEDNQQKSDRLKVEKQLAEEQELKAQQEKIALLEQNKFNPEWLSDNFGASGGARCKPYVENLALHSFEWTDGWLESKFPSYFTSNEGEPYVLTLIGDRIKFQNGFGAWSKTKYYCKYNVQTKKVIEVWAD